MQMQEQKWISTTRSHGRPPGREGSAGAWTWPSWNPGRAGGKGRDRVIRKGKGKRKGQAQGKPIGKSRKGEKTAQVQEKVLPEGELKILALNVDGIRQDRKRKAFGTYLSGLRPQPDVCIIGETHLLDAEIKQIQYPSYQYANHSSRGEDVVPVRGGVLILVKFL